MGTGFAQPKPTRISAVVPIGSKWASGFSVSRPMFYAVGSPSFFATRPCAHSCSGSAINTTTILASSCSMICCIFPVKIASMIKTRSFLSDYPSICRRTVNAACFTYYTGDIRKIQGLPQDLSHRQSACTFRYCFDRSLAGKGISLYSGRRSRFAISCAASKIPIFPVL